MNPRTTAARSAPLSVETEKAQSQEASFVHVFQDLCSSAMDEALGIENAALAPVVGLNSYMFNLYESALCFTPVFGHHLEMLSQAFALSMELQLNLLDLLALPAWSHADPAESISASQDQSTAEELAQSMDVAMGERFTDAPISIVASSPAATATTAITAMRSRGIAERQGSRRRGAGERMTSSYGLRQSHG